MIDGIEVGHTIRAINVGVIGTVVQVYRNEQGVVDRCLVRNYDNINVFIDLTEFSPEKDMRH